jgi:hypothetical protein
MRLSHSQYELDTALTGPRAAGRKDRAPELQNAVEICRRLTAVVTWGVATGLGFLLCAVLNITLMQAVRANGALTPATRY